MTSPRTARKKAAQNLRLHIIRIRHCDECICRWVWSFAQLGCSRRSRNIFCNVAHTTVLKETSSLLRFHFQRRSLSCRSKLIQVARWPLGLPPRFAVLFRFVVRPWRSERVEAVKTLELRKNSNSTANAFATVAYSYETEVWGFAQLFSYSCAAMSLLYGNQLEITWLWSYIWLTCTM